MNHTSRYVRLVLEYDGQVTEGEVQAIAQEAVLKMENVYLVQATLDVPGSLFHAAKAELNEDSEKELV